jgi:hypothetical protein
VARQPDPAVWPHICLSLSLSLSLSLCVCVCGCTHVCLFITNVTWVRQGGVLMYIIRLAYDVMATDDHMWNESIDGLDDILWHNVPRGTTYHH